MALNRIVPRLLLGTSVLGMGIGLLIYFRLVEVREARDRTAAFCQTVKVGDDLLAVVENAQSGASRLGAVQGAHEASTAHQSGEPRSLPGKKFSVIFEGREGEPGWPRYVIWTEPSYFRIFCSLEGSREGKVKAIHLGPIDDNSKDPGFVQSLLEDWLK